MGGKSSSSSSQSTSTVQTDKRIAATDSAIVTTVEGSNNIITDYEAIEKAGNLTYEAISKIGDIAMQALTQNQSAVDVLKSSTDNAFNFVDNQNRDEESRQLKELAPWLVLGVSVIALSSGFKK